MSGSNLFTPDIDAIEADITALQSDVSDLQTEVSNLTFDIIYDNQPGVARQINVDNDNIEWLLATEKSVIYKKDDGAGGPFNAYPFQWIVEFQDSEYQSVNIRQDENEPVFLEVGESNSAGVISKGVRLEGKDGSIELFDFSTTWFKAEEEGIFAVGIKGSFLSSHVAIDESGVTALTARNSKTSIIGIVNELNDATNGLVRNTNDRDWTLPTGGSWRFINPDNEEGNTFFSRNANGTFHQILRGEIEYNVQMFDTDRVELHADNSILALSGSNGINFKSDMTTNKDYEVTDATKGIIFRDSQGTPHKWRVTVDNSGSLVTSDLGAA